MLRPRVLFALAVLCAALTRVHAAAEWDKLKAGMASDAALKELGEPLIRTYGRGFEVWIYDGKGEALFTGSLKAWTVAKPSAESLSRPIALDVLIKARPRIRLAPLQALPQPIQLPEANTTRFRYR